MYVFIIFWTEAAVKVRKQKNFSDAEIETKLGAAGGGKGSSGVMARQKDDIWKEITKQFSAITSSQRTVKEVKGEWFDLKLSTKLHIDGEGTSARPWWKGSKCWALPLWECVGLASCHTAAVAWRPVQNPFGVWQTRSGGTHWTCGKLQHFWFSFGAHLWTLSVLSL